MATYQIIFQDSDRYSERNGVHAPVESGAAFIAEYGEGLAVECDGEESPLAADHIDSLAIGESVNVLGPWGECITVTREA